MNKTIFTYSISPLIVLAAILLLVHAYPAYAQQTQKAPMQTEAEKGSKQVETRSGYEKVPHFGGPKSVGAQVKADDELKKAPYLFIGLSKGVQPYYDFKKRLQENHGLAFGVDYNLLYQGASESMGEDHAAGGVLRLFGTWALVGRGSPDVGALTAKVENRHHLGTDIAPQQLAGEVGYAGLTAITYSDARSVLTNLYWQQSLIDNRLAFVAGITDTTDYVAVYGLGNPWTDFNNLAFSTDPTIPIPNQGVGAAVRGTIADNYYVLAGLADANGDPTDPLDSFDSFINQSEYFKHIELGWFRSWEDRFTDKIHLTAWQADERESAQVADGWGMAFSFNKKIGDRWMPFLRLGISDGGGAFLERSVSTGVGYYPAQRSDLLGIGFNWGRPSEGTYGSGLRDQYTTEIFYCWQLFQHMTITPDIQFIVNPALNPDVESIWIVGLRGRINL